MLDIAIGVANSAQRALVVYVETASGAPPVWLDELGDSLRLRSVGLLVGTEATRQADIERIAPVAVLYESTEPVPSLDRMKLMPLDTMSTEKLVATDPLPTAFWEKVGRAADYALPRGSIVPTAWCAPPELPPVPRSQEAPTPSTSCAAAQSALHALARRLDDAHLPHVIAGIEAGMVPLERAVQAVLESEAPRERQEAVLRALSPALRAL